MAVERRSQRLNPGSTSLLPHEQKVMDDRLFMRFINPPLQTSSGTAVANTGSDDVVRFQFPPKVLSDGKRVNWMEIDVKSYEPMAYFMGSKARQIQFRAEYVVYGLVFVIAGIAFIIFSDNPQQILSYGVFIVIAIGALFTIYGVFASKKRTFKYDQESSFSPPERYSENCIHLVTRRKPPKDLPKSMTSDGLTRYFCSAIRDQYGEPRPIDKCIKNCPDFKT